MQLALLPLLLLLLHAAWLDPLRPRLEEPGSVRVLDRFGQTLAEVRDRRWELSAPVRLESLSPWVVPALISAEDARFFWHPGLDPLAMLRAAAQAIASGRVVSGGSTITQQLARTSFDRPRTLGGKWRELAHAVRLELELDKPTILEAYLARVYFGPRVRGIAAAARHYFDKPASALSLAEAAALVSLVQGPSRLDPERFPERLLRRRDQVLRRMLELGHVEREVAEQAMRAPLTLHRGYVLPGGFHFVRAAMAGKLGRVPGGADATRTPWRSTLDGELQAEIEGLVRGFHARFTERRASAAAVLVLSNRSAAVRAYVGSPDHRAVAELGQNDGVLALRQPGSALKPFVYALALWDLQLHPASLLPDLEQRFGSAAGDYLPHNYDRRFHGPVRLGQSLAASLNVPAVALAERLGPERVIEVLRRLGFSHLEQPAAHYGPAIALGVGEVQLLELAAAYASLGRGGSHLPPRFFESDPLPAPERVLPEDVARQIIDILSDPRERAATFGRDGPLEFDRPIAVKTGTSKGNRDNWAIGVSPELTVAVWVGNFDGSPMLRSSGASGAGPLFHQVMDAALRRVPGDGGWEPAVGTNDEREPLTVCAASGLLAGPDCPHRLGLDVAPSNAPRERCSWHRRRCADGAARASCPLVEVLPERYAAWGLDSGRWLANAARAARSPEPPSLGDPAPRITFPRAGQRFVVDPHVSPTQQELLLRAEADAHATLRFELDGALVCEAIVPFECSWPLRRGEHELVVRAVAGGAARVVFRVE